jgi:hypothetical protein
MLFLRVIWRCLRHWRTICNLLRSRSSAQVHLDAGIWGVLHGSVSADLSNRIDLAYLKVAGPLKRKLSVGVRQAVFGEVILGLLFPEDKT